MANKCARPDDNNNESNFGKRPNLPLKMELTVEVKCSQMKENITKKKKKKKKKNEFSYLKRMTPLQRI